MQHFRYIIRARSTVTRIKHNTRKKIFNFICNFSTCRCYSNAKCHYYKANCYYSAHNSVPPPPCRNNSFDRAHSYSISTHHFSVTEKILRNTDGEIFTFEHFEENFREKREQRSKRAACGHVAKCVLPASISLNHSLFWFRTANGANAIATGASARVRRGHTQWTSPDVSLDIIFIFLSSTTVTISVICNDAI